MRRLGLALLLFPVLSAAPAQAAQQTRRFVVFFTEWSAALDRPAQAVVRDAARWIEDHPGVRVEVSGAADLTGSRRANMLLSALRAQVVTDLLAHDGIPETQVKQEAIGSVGYALTAQESRRVMIVVNAP